jgi:ornithine--oxo-acid transaminase
MAGVIEGKPHLDAVTRDGVLQEQYAQGVNPQWLRLLKLLRMDVQYERCIGAELHTTDGKRILDFLSGYCVHNLGHNHPAVIAAMKDELDRRGPAMLQSHIPERAGELAAALCQRAGGKLKKAFFLKFRQRRN